MGVSKRRMRPDKCGRYAAQAMHLEAGWLARDLPGTGRNALLDQLGIGHLHGSRRLGPGRLNVVLHQLNLLPRL